MIKIDIPISMPHKPSHIPEKSNTHRHSAAQRPPVTKTAKPADQKKSTRKAALVHWLNKYGLSRRKLRRNRLFAYFGNHLFSRDLWSFRPDCIARGWLIGAISAATPFLGAQIVMALPFIIIFRANLPVALGLILLTNPATAVPYYGFAYWLGSWVLGDKFLQRDDIHVMADRDFSTLMSEMYEKGFFNFLREILSGVFLNLMVGCLIVGLVVGFGGYFLIQFLVKHPPVRILKKTVPPPKE